MRAFALITAALCCWLASLGCAGLLDDRRSPTTEDEVFAQCKTWHDPYRATSSVSGPDVWPRTGGVSLFSVDIDQGGRRWMVTVRTGDWHIRWEARALGGRELDTVGVEGDASARAIIISEEMVRVGAEADGIHLALYGSGRRHDVHVPAYYCAGFLRAAKAQGWTR